MKMGTPAPTFPPGIDCDICWAFPEFFGPGRTPKYITAVLVAGEKNLNWQPVNGEAVEGRFTITQVPGTPCQFQFNENGTVITVSFSSVSTDFEAQNPEGFNSYTSLGGLRCSTAGFSNNAFHWDGGTFKIEIPKDPL